VPEGQSDDPIFKQSYANAILVSSFLLVLTLAWSLYQEMFSLRPWRYYQGRFVTAYQKYLKTEMPKQKAAEEAILNSPQYKSLIQQADAAQKATDARVQEIVKELAYIDRRNSALADTFMTERARIAALVYQTEISSSASSRQSRLADVEAARKRILPLDLPTPDGKIEHKKFTFPELEAEFTGLKDRKAALVGEQARLLNGVRDLRQQAKTYFEDRMVGLTESQLSSLYNAAKKLDPVIRQINVGSAGLVDRCQSCHVAMDPKVVPANLVLSKSDLGMAKSKDAPFASHPNLELLKIHDPDKFGCSACHGGNGRATNSVEHAHGRYEHWLWPLYYKENVEAGCQSCHAADMVLEQGPVISYGKELFRRKGCVGCHRYEGFDNEGEQLLASRQTIRIIEQQKKDLELNVPRVIFQADHAEDDATARRLYQKADDMRVTTSNIDARIEQLDRRNASLMREEKKLGPSLKEARMKLRKEWIPYWLEHTHEYRPTTKMPQFRFKGGEIQAIAAFVWQNALTGPALPKQAPGNAAHGKQLLETRGCLGCHSIGEGDKSIGAQFAANLSRVGEKDNFDYLVRWVHNPRERTRPYDPIARVDLGPEDYAKFGKPFVFDLDHDRSPDGKHLLQVQLPTVMPSLRLSLEDSRDIATYLVTLRHPDATYPSADFMDNSALKDKGRALVKNYGCASCHEISGLEEEARIGTELTVEGSKPIERLDFALLTEPAKRGVDPDGKKSPLGTWYDQKGFFEAKLKQTDVFDKGRLTPQLKMPQPTLSDEDRNALVTFLLGSVDLTLPEGYVYKPGDARHDIQEGWWVVSKYNCMGCHVVHVGQKSSLMGLPQYQAENKDKLPPQLVGEGARVDPNWLAKFLENPALNATDTNRNGVRNYLAVRMPTFSFSDGEVQKIVRFFAAMASQSMPYMPQKLEPLTDAERTMARQLFTHPAAPCLKCHATGVPAHDAIATAPNFLLARERLKPAWSYRWILDPSRMAPGTAMPSGLFRKEGDHWVFAGQLPASFQGYTKDQADLLIRYLFQMTPEEQRMLVGRTPTPGGKTAGK
jgi:cytochrome c551/c552